MTAKQISVFLENKPGQMLELAKQLKVGCIVTIPSRIDYIKDRVNEMYTAYRSSLNSIDEILRTLGISTSLSGYRCLAVSIKKLSQNPTLLLKEIYPDTAKECGLNDASCVEHTIRTAIRSAWIKRNINNWAQYFPLNETNDIDLPTNKEFISAIARHI